MEPIIRFQNVSKKFGSKTIINNMSFDIYPGEIFGIIGASGSGKTTLLRMLIGFYPLESGKIFFNSQDITKNINAIRKIFGFTTQDNCFYQELTVKENMHYFGKLYGMPTELINQNAERLLNLVELWDARDKLAKDLSGGMLRRLDIACSLIHNPKILILDEPTTGLDLVLRKHIWNIVKRINALGTTIVISSHLLDEMEILCTSVAMIKNGALLIRGTPTQLKDFYSRNEEIHLETYPGRYKLIVENLRKMKLPITYVTHMDHKVILYTPNAEKTLHQILHLLENMGEKLLDVDVNKPSLNEVFEAFVTR